MTNRPTITNLNGHKVCILGFGREGRATLNVLRAQAPQATITIADANPELKLEPGLPFITGPNYLDRLNDFDYIIKTPGLPWRPKGELATHITSATELFLTSLPSDVTVIGVTGTKGKSTTAYLIHTALTAAGRTTILAGNIGEPMLTHLAEAKSDTIFVLELSSYQLETLHTSPSIAVITSIFPDHLDYHGSFETYVAAKRHITQFQHPGDVVFYNATSEACRDLAGASPGRHQPFTAADFPGQPAPALASPESRGDLAAAYLVARYLGVEATTAQQALEAATGLPHRQENLGRHAGIEWIDDSGATTPQSTLAALAAVGDQLGTIIVGGLNRDYEFTELGARLAASSVHTIILFPDTGAAIQAAIEAHHPTPTKTYFATKDMAEAVALAAAHTAPSHIALLSPGSPSYNLYKDYYDRGEMFQAAVRSLKSTSP